MDNDLVKRIMEKVYPGNVVVERSSALVLGTCFFVVPGKNGPRWIVPENWRYGRVFLRQWRPYDPGSRLKWRLLMSAYRAGMLAKIPGVTTVSIAEPNQSWKHVGWDLPDPPTPVIYVGTPGPARKVVVGLVDRSACQLVAIAKIPMGSASSGAIQHENVVLSKLALLKPEMAPHSLYADGKSGITVQEAVLGTPTGRKLTAPHIAWLLGLRITEESISLREVASSVDLHTELLGAISEETRSVIEQVRSEIDDLAPLPAVWVHGDFAPWNLKMRPGRKLTAVDWEFSSPRGLPLFDLVYFRTIQMFLFEDKHLFPRYVRPLIRSYLETLGVACNMFEKIVLACLLHDWRRAFVEEDFKRADFLLLQLRNRLRRGK